MAAGGVLLDDEARLTRAAGAATARLGSLLEIPLAVVLAQLVGCHCALLPAAPHRESCGRDADTMLGVTHVASVRTGLLA